MARKDPYEALVRNYEFMLGKMPNREQFKEALKLTLSEEDTASYPCYFSINIVDIKIL